MCAHVLSHTVIHVLSQTGPHRQALTVHQAGKKVQKPETEENILLPP